MAGPASPHVPPHSAECCAHCRADLMEMLVLSLLEGWPFFPGKGSSTVGAAALIVIACLVHYQSGND